MKKIKFTNSNYPKVIFSTVSDDYSNYYCVERNALKELEDDLMSYNIDAVYVENIVDDFFRNPDYSGLKQNIKNAVGKHEVDLRINHFEETINLLLFDDNKVRDIRYSNLLEINHGDDTYYLYGINNHVLSSEVKKMVRKIELKKHMIDINDSISGLALLSPKAASAMIHEVFGHLLEEDRFSKDLFEFFKSLNMKNISIIDDPTLKGYAGTYLYDDEGTKGHRKELIENGVLQSFMGTRKNCSFSQPGNARCIDYSFEPITRMSNLYLSAGENEECELETKVMSQNGVIVYDFSYGATDGLNIELGIDLACRLINGKKEYFNNGVAKLSVIEFIDSILNLGNKTHIFNMECHKYGQWFYEVSTGSPAILMKELPICKL